MRRKYMTDKTVPFSPRGGETGNPLGVQETHKSQCSIIGLKQLGLLNIGPLNLNSFGAYCLSYKFLKFVEKNFKFFSRGA